MAAKFRKVDPRIWHDERFQKLWRNRWHEAGRSAQSHPWPINLGRWKEHHYVTQRNRLKTKNQRRKAWGFVEQRFGGRACVFCGALATCLDHVLPLTWGGTSDHWNLQPLCVSCNSLKYNTLPEEACHA